MVNGRRERERRGRGRREESERKIAMTITSHTKHKKKVELKKISECHQFLHLPRIRSSRLRISCSPASLCRDDESWVPLGSLLVHIFLLCVAIRRGWRHFKFLCVWTQFVMYVSMFSSTSFVLLFMCSIQSSGSSSWLDVLSSSSSNEILLSCSYSSCVLSSS